MKHYDEKTYVYWEQLMNDIIICFRGRIIKLFKEKHRFVFMVSSVNDIRYRVIVDHYNSFFDTVVNEVQNGMLVAIKGHVISKNSKDNTIDVSLIEIMLINTPTLPSYERGLSLKTNNILFENRYYHLRLINDQSAKMMAIVKDAILRKTRQFLFERSFIECEMPFLQKNYYGGTAYPFTTYANHSKSRYYLKPNSLVPMLLHVAGGIERIFEISSYFRNGGTDATHSVPYCALELYCAYTNYDTIRKLAEELIIEIINESCKYIPENAVLLDSLINDSITRVSFADAVKEYYKDINTRAEHFVYLKDLNNGYIQYKDAEKSYRWIKKELIRNIRGLRFIDYLPAGASPFIATTKFEKKKLFRGYLVLNGVNIIEYFEGNIQDTDAITDLLQEQNKALKSDSKDTIRRDYEALIHAFRLGMPPYASLTISLDRVIALLLHKEISNSKVIL